MQKYKLLCDAIKQRCTFQHWYGPEFLGPTQIYMSEKDDPCRVGFEFRPASEKQLQETEDILGFSLPSILRELYTQIANGGFGPAYGLRGIQDGNPQRGGTIPEFFLSRADADIVFFDLEGDEVQPEKDFFFLYSQWPHSLIPLIDWGCGQEISIDCTNGHILQCAPWDESRYQLVYLADSLEEWLQRWLQGELYPQETISPKEVLDAESFLRGEYF